MTSPPRRFTDLDVIRRAAAKLRDDPDPVRRRVADWLRDVTDQYDGAVTGEAISATLVARAALTGTEAPSTVSPGLSPAVYTVDEEPQNTR